jgi:hypothetical protein
MRGGTLRSSYNGICASSPYQVIVLEASGPSESEEAGLTRCAIVGVLSIRWQSFSVLCRLLRSLLLVADAGFIPVSPYLFNC